MQPSESVLKEALERSVFLVPEIPGRIQWLSIPGIEGRMTSLSHPLANMVGAAEFSDETADESIRRIHEMYASQQKGFTWIVGPISKPTDIADRLLAAGFVKFADMAGMVLTNLSEPLGRNPRVRIRRATADDLEEATAAMARGFGLPEAVMGLVLEARLKGTGEPRSDVYLAYVDHVGEPVACATLDYVPGQPIVRLGGAATLTEHRGMGVYKSLVARRIEDAAGEGMQAAVIQSARVSSEPICRRMGFREICDMAMYSWAPQADGQELRELADDWTV